MPTVTWYPKQGSPLIRHWVAVPPPRCSPAVCSVDYRWQVNAVPVGTGSALYLRRAWRGKYVSVHVTVHAYGMAWTRTYRWLRPVHWG